MFAEEDGVWGYLDVEIAKRVKKAEKSGKLEELRDFPRNDVNFILSMRRMVLMNPDAQRDILNKTLDLAKQKIVKKNEESINMDYILLVRTIADVLWHAHVHTKLSLKHHEDYILNAGQLVVNQLQIRFDQTSLIKTFAMEASVQWAALMGYVVDIQKMLKINISSTDSLCWAFVNITNLEVGTCARLGDALLDILPTKRVPNNLRDRNRMIESIYVLQHQMNTLATWEHPSNSVIERLNENFMKNLDSISRQDDCKIEIMVLLFGFLLRTKHREKMLRPFLVKRVLKHFADTKKALRSLEIITRTCCMTEHFKFWDCFLEKSLVRLPSDFVDRTWYRDLIPSPLIEIPLLEQILSEIFEKPKCRFFSELMPENEWIATSFARPMGLDATPMNMCVHLASYAAPHLPDMLTKYILPQMDMPLSLEDTIHFKFNVLQVYRLVMGLVLIRQSLTPWPHKYPSLLEGNNTKEKEALLAKIREPLVNLMNRCVNLFSVKDSELAEYPLDLTLLCGPHLGSPQEDSWDYEDTAGDALGLSFLCMLQDRSMDFEICDSRWIVLAPRHGSYTCIQRDRSRARLVRLLKRKQQYTPIVELLRHILYAIPVCFFYSDAPAPGLPVRLLIHPDWTIAQTMSHCLQLVIACARTDAQRMQVFKTLVHCAMDLISLDIECVTKVSTLVSQIIMCMRIWAHVKKGPIITQESKTDAQLFVQMAFSILLIPVPKLRGSCDVILRLTSVLFPDVCQWSDLLHILDPTNISTRTSINLLREHVVSKNYTMYSETSTSTSDAEYNAFEREMRPAIMIETDAMKQLAEVGHQLDVLFAKSQWTSCLSTIRKTLTTHFSNNTLFNSTSSPFCIVLSSNVSIFVLSTHSSVDDSTENIFKQIHGAILHLDWDIESDADVRLLLEDLIGMSIGTEVKSAAISFLMEYHDEYVRNKQNESQNVQGRSFSKSFFSRRNTSQEQTLTYHNSWISQKNDRSQITMMRVFTNILRYRCKILFPGWKDSMRVCFNFICQLIKLLPNNEWEFSLEFLHFLAESAEILSFSLQAHSNVRNVTKFRILIAEADTIWPRAQRRNIWNALQRISGFHELPMFKLVSSIDSDLSDLQVLDSLLPLVSAGAQKLVRADVITAAQNLLLLGPVSLGTVMHKPDSFLWQFFNYCVESGSPGVVSRYLCSHWQVGDVVIAGGESFVPFVDKYYEEIHDRGRSDAIVEGLFDSIKTWLYYNGSCVRSLEHAAVAPIVVVALLVAITHTDPRKRGRAMEILGCIEFAQGHALTLSFHAGSPLIANASFTRWNDDTATTAITASTQLMKSCPDLAFQILRETCIRIPQLQESGKGHPAGATTDIFNALVKVVQPWCGSPKLVVVVAAQESLVFRLEIFWLCAMALYQHGGIPQVHMILPLANGLAKFHASSLAEFLLIKLEQCYIHSDSDNAGSFDAQYDIATVLMCSISGVDLVRTNSSIMFNLSKALFGVQLKDWKLRSHDFTGEAWISYSIHEEFEDKPISMNKWKSMVDIQRSILQSINPFVFENTMDCMSTLPQIISFALCCVTRPEKSAKLMEPSPERAVLRFLLRFAIKKNETEAPRDSLGPDDIVMLDSMCSKHPCEFTANEVNLATEVLVQLLRSVSTCLLDIWCHCLLSSVMGIYRYMMPDDPKFCVRALSIYKSVRAYTSSKTLNVSQDIGKLSSNSVFRAEMLALMNILYRSLLDPKMQEVTSLAIACLQQVCSKTYGTLPSDTFYAVTRFACILYGSRIERISESIFELLLCCPVQCIEASHAMIQILVLESLRAVEDTVQTDAAEVRLFCDLAQLHDNVRICYILWMLNQGTTTSHDESDVKERLISLKLDEALVRMVLDMMNNPAEAANTFADTVLKVFGTTAVEYAIYQCMLQSLILRKNLFLPSACLYIVDALLRKEVTLSRVDYFLRTASQFHKSASFELKALPGAKRMLEASNRICSFGFLKAVPKTPRSESLDNSDLQLDENLRTTLASEAQHIVGVVEKDDATSPVVSPRRRVSLVDKITTPAPRDMRISGAGVKSFDETKWIQRAITKDAVDPIKIVDHIETELSRYDESSRGNGYTLGVPLVPKTPRIHIDEPQSSTSEDLVNRRLRKRLLQILSNDEESAHIRKVFGSYPQLDTNVLDFVQDMIKFRSSSYSESSTKEIDETYIKVDAFKALKMDSLERAKIRSKVQSGETSGTIFDDLFEKSLQYLNENFLFKYLRLYNEL